MPVCIAEGSYNALFITAVITAVLFILTAAFSYDRLNKVSTNQLTDDQVTIGKHISMVSIVFAVIAFGIFFVLFFGFKKRLMGVYTTTTVKK